MLNDSFTLSSFFLPLARFVRTSVSTCLLLVKAFQRSVADWRWLLVISLSKSPSSSPSVATLSVRGLCEQDSHLMTRTTADHRDHKDLTSWTLPGCQTFSLLLLPLLSISSRSSPPSMSPPRPSPIPRHPLSRPYAINSSSLTTRQRARAARWPIPN